MIHPYKAGNAFIKEGKVYISKANPSCEHKSGLKQTANSKQHTQQEPELMEIGNESEDAQSLGGEGGKGQKG
jgi:hypothetical protein